MNTLKTLVFSALFSIFAVSTAVAYDNAPTPEQVENVLTQICGERVTSECLDEFLKGSEHDPHLALTGYELARDILGDDFITPDEVAAACNLFYSDAQLAAFKETLPVREVLWWIRDNNYMLVAGPSSELSFMDVRRINDSLFSSKDGKGWYANAREKFASEDTVGPVWLALRKGAVPGSTIKTWDEQRSLLSDVEYVPNATKLAWGVVTHKEVRGVYLMDNVWVRTSSVESDGYRVNIGFFGQRFPFFGRRGLSVSYWGDADRIGYLGVSSARKF